MTNGDDLIGITHSENGGVGQSYGLTKREHIAILAMQGLLADASKYPDYQDNGKIVAEAAVKYADYLIAALNKEEAT